MVRTLLISFAPPGVEGWGSNPAPPALSHSARSNDSNMRSGFPAPPPFNLESVSTNILNAILK